MDFTNLEERKKETKTQIALAFKSGDEKEINTALNNFTEMLKDEFNAYREDESALQSRGYRKLLNKEKKFYNKLIDALKSDKPNQALTELLTTSGMPQTIIEDVYKDLKKDHPLLGLINFKYVGYATKWLLSTADNKAVWGKITDEIKKQIEASFREIDLTQNKLSAFVLLSKGMLELGPVWLDNYIRTILEEALALGLEYGILKGKGAQGEPIGACRKIGASASHNDTDGYSFKTKIVVKDFGIANYCDLVGKLTKKSNGAVRAIKNVQLIVNPVDYIKKIIPATTVQALDGTYKNNLFPVPTDVVVSAALDEGEAVLGILNEYFLGLGSSINGNIEYSDDYKFIEDMRAFKIKMYASGTAEDDTSFLYLDIKNIVPTYITVRQVSDATAAAEVKA